LGLYYASHRDDADHHSSRTGCRRASFRVLRAQRVGRDGGARPRRCSGWKARLADSRLHRTTPPSYTYIDAGILIMPFARQMLAFTRPKQISPSSRSTYTPWPISTVPCPSSHHSSRLWRAPQDLQPSRGPVPLFRRAWLRSYFVNNLARTGHGSSCTHEPAQSLS
jgi:hypothetical protein